MHTSTPASVVGEFANRPGDQHANDRDDAAEHAQLTCGFDNRDHPVRRISAEPCESGELRGSRFEPIFKGDKDRTIKDRK